MKTYMRRTINNEAVATDRHIRVYSEDVLSVLFSDM
jgi:hypothetical protein